MADIDVRKTTSHAQSAERLMVPGETCGFAESFHRLRPNGGTCFAVPKGFLSQL